MSELEHVKRCLLDFGCLVCMKKLQDFPTLTAVCPKLSEPSRFCDHAMQSLAELFGRKDED